MKIQKKRAGPKLTRKEYDLILRLIQMTRKFGPRRMIDIILFLAYESEVVA